MNQSLPPSLDQQLADARTAVAVHIQRIAELEAAVQAQRAEIDRIEADTIARLYQSALTLMAMPSDATDAIVMATYERLPPEVQPVFADGIRELNGYVDRIAELEQRAASLQSLAGALCRSVSRPLGYDDEVVLVSTAALRALDAALRDDKPTEG